MLRIQLPSKPGVISSARAAQASLPDIVTGRDVFSATVAATSVAPACVTLPPMISAPPPITLLPAGHRTAAAFGLDELLTLVIVTVWSPLRPGAPVAPVEPVAPVGPMVPGVPWEPVAPVRPSWFQLTASSLFLH